MKTKPQTPVPILKMTMALTSLCVSVLFIASAVGLVPDRDNAVLAGRVALCETLAIDSTVAAQRDDIEEIRVVFTNVAQRLPDLLSMALRKHDGTILVSAGDHVNHWQGVNEATSTATHIFVPITIDDQPWGRVEVAFLPISSGPWHWVTQNSSGPLVIFMGLVCFMGYWLYLRAMFGHRNAPAAGAVPHRVRAAMNTLAEGVLILDNQERIALANQAFAEMLGVPPEQLQGKTVSELPWFQHDQQEDSSSLVWTESVTQGKPQTGIVLGLKNGKAVPHTLSVNTAPIVGEDGQQRGAIATFDNLTPLERKNAQLRKVLTRLKQSRTVVRRQNHELRALATRDPLTGCFNRRTLFGEMEKLWNASVRYHHAFSVVMCDVDHFKSINDRFGHNVGDEVLKRVAEVLRATARKTDLVCRYGGEEFCVLLPHIDIEEGMQAAERFRHALAAQKCANVDVTASFGISSYSLGAGSMLDMLEQADKALYGSKRSGRNRVMRFDKVSAELLTEKVAQKSNEEKNVPDSQSEIPFHAVTALLSALAYRDMDTAEHSRRVADLCVMVGVDLMSQRDCYIMEVAALLHDIGKLGVPDAVLFKAGALTAEDWKIIRAHEAIGLDILKAAFTSKELTGIIRSYHFWYGDDGPPSADSSETWHGEQIPLGARILAVADAYDSMTSDRAYRQGATQERAFAELRRCSTSQFDPALVERFIQKMESRDQNPSTVPMAISKKTALQIGLQIEKLARAADGQDIATIAQMACQLKDTAKEHGITPIAEVAAQLEKSATSTVKPSQMSLVQLTVDLLEMCRSTQRSLLPTTRTTPSVRQRRAAEKKQPDS